MRRWLINQKQSVARQVEQTVPVEADRLAKERESIRELIQDTIRKAEFLIEIEAGGETTQSEENKGENSGQVNQLNGSLHESEAIVEASSKLENNNPSLTKIDTTGLKIYS